MSWGNNLRHPILSATPSFGEAFRPHGDDGKSSADYQKYLADPARRLTVRVDWGAFVPVGSMEGFSDRIRPFDGPINISAELTIQGLGRRPALRLLGSSVASFEPGEQLPPSLEVTWSTRTDPQDEYPEYLATLCLSRIMSADGDGNSEDSDIVLRRALHVLPPPDLELQYDLREVLWAPELCDDTIMNHEETSRFNFTSADTHPYEDAASAQTLTTRRGFGLELETVQLPPDADEGYFTLLEQFRGIVEQARAVASDDKADIWRRLHLWDCQIDVQVENAAPYARHDLYKRLLVLAENNDFPISDELKMLVLGGKFDLPDDLKQLLPDDCATNQASPEYKSPLPPNELFHEFPPPCEGDDADREIRMLLDGVLKNCQVSQRSIMCPTISDIGQSASSIHVHVNIRNPDAWPRTSLEDIDDVLATQSLLSVVLNYIRFDGIIRTFSKPWMWRDRSLAPMFASGPEFSWQENAWSLGKTIIDHDNKCEKDLYNVPGLFNHLFVAYNSALQGDAAAAGNMFDTVFDPEQLRKSVFRWNGLNLFSLRKYGTIEFRRMHATLDADFISSWTWFVVAFVEHFSKPEAFEELGKACWESDGPSEGLAKLVQAQNEATIEDLAEIISPMVPPKTFKILLGANTK